MRSYKSESQSLFSDLPETSIDQSPTSCLAPLCKTIEKMGKEIIKIQITYPSSHTKMFTKNSLEINKKQL